MLYTYSGRLSFFLYMQAKTISKCITPMTSKRQIYTYTPDTGNTLEIPQWWTFSLAERFEQLHENDLICLQDIWIFSCTYRKLCATRCCCLYNLIHNTYRVWKVYLKPNQIEQYAFTIKKSKLDTDFRLWFNMLGVQVCSTFPCLYGRWKCYNYVQAKKE